MEQGQTGGHDVNPAFYGEDLDHNATVEKARESAALYQSKYINTKV